MRASRVNDLVCDCCDGSDEYATGVCSNDCVAAGAAARAEAAERVKSIGNGLATATQWSAEATASKAGWETEIAELRTQLAEKQAVAASIEAEQKVAEATVTALVGVSTDVAAVTEGIGEENKKVTQAVAFVALKFTLQAAADELFPGERKDLKQRLATLLSVALDEVFITITSGSANVEAKAFYKSTADADTAEAAATSSLGSPALASSYLGTTVTDTPTVEKGAVIPTFTLDPSLPGGIGGVAFLLAMLTIGCARFQAAKKRTAVGAPYKGPCSTGCCSAYSLRGWSVGVLTYVLLSGCFPFSSATETLSHRASFAAEPWRSHVSHIVSHIEYISRMCLWLVGWFVG